MAPDRTATRPASAADGPFELAIGPPRAALDALLPGLVVELVAGAAARAVPGLLAAAPARRRVVRRGPAPLVGLAAAGPLLVHGAGRDLLGAVLAAPLVQLAL